MNCTADAEWFVTFTTASVIVTAILSIACSVILVAYQTYKILNLPVSTPVPANRITNRDLNDSSIKGVENGEIIAGVISRIIINIALIDAVVAGSHLWGSIQNYYIPKLNTNSSTVTPILQETEACVTQAAITVYSTYVSFLWTVALGIVVVCVVRPSWNWVWARDLTMRICNLICWGFPLLLVIWLGASNTLGYNEGLDSAWCFVHLFEKDHVNRVVYLLFSYWLWVTIMILALVIILMMYFFLVIKTLPSKRKPTFEEAADIGTSLTKIIIATTFFAGFRMAGFILGAIVLERLQNGGSNAVNFYHCSQAYAAGMWTSSVLDTAQGILNCTVFILIPLGARPIQYRAMQRKQKKVTEQFTPQL